MSSIKQAAEEMLLQTIIPFWKGLRDEENGGFYGYMDFDLKLDKKAEKGCILNSRILWFFSEAAMLTGRADLAEDARHAYQFFLKNCYDEENGGVYWSCDYTGKPQDTTKHTYNQALHLCPFRLLPADQRPRCADLRKKDLSSHRAALHRQRGLSGGLYHRLEAGEQRKALGKRCHGGKDHEYPAPCVRGLRRALSGQP